MLEKSSITRRPTLLAWILWATIAVVVCGLSAHQGFKRTVVPAYRGASLAWIEHRPIYELTSIHGFLYLPSAAALGVPFLGLPSRGHEIAFRAVTIAFLAWATWRLSRHIGPAIARAAFLGLTLLIAPVAIGSAMAGQMNIVLAAASAAAATDMIEQRWNRAAFWLGLGFALKPQMAVLLLLAGAVFPAMRLRAAIALLAALLIPFVLQQPAYVAEQYQLFVEKSRLSSNPAEANIRNTDINGLLTALSINLPTRALWLLRLAMAPLTLLAAFWTTRRHNLAHGVVMTVAWAAVYLMLFNPRTEGGSYVIAAVPLAALTMSAAMSQFRGFEVGLLVFIAIGWTASYPISHALYALAGRLAGSGSVIDLRSSFSPLLAVIFLGYLLWLGLKTNRARAGR